MKKKNYSLLGSYYLEWLVLVTIIVYIFASWKQTLNKELVAEPIVTDRSVTVPQGKGSVNTPSNSESTQKFISINDKLPGNPGYLKESLGQPCDQNPGNKIVPNLPGGYKTQDCDTSKGLVCIQGLVEGGGICLKDINQECNAKNECTPLADACIYGFCQQADEVINKPCTNTEECEDNGQFNHICDPIAKRCRFNIFPKDSGCVLDSQCDLFSKTDTINQAECLNQQPLVNYDATLIGTSFRITGTTILESNYYISLLTSSKIFLGRYLIEDIKISSNNTFVTLRGTANITTGVTDYIIDVGGKKGGICVIRYPLGTKPPLVAPEANTTLLYPCDAGLDKLNGFCVENGRTSTKGSQGQVCNGSGLTCQDGLQCTFDSQFVDRLNGNQNKIGVGPGSSIGGIFTNNIGKCTKQVATSKEFCDDTTKTCKNSPNGNICLLQTDIDGNIIRYCGRDWNTFDTSELINCPKNFTYKKIDNKCFSNPGNVCISNSDCLSNSCNQTSREIKYYDLENTEFVNYDFELSPSPASIMNSATPNSKLIMTKNFGTCQSVPTATGFYSFSNNNLKITLLYNGNNDPYIQNINFEDTSIVSPEVSLVEKEDNSVQVNVIYKDSYPNYLRREYNLNQQNISPTGNNLYIDKRFSLAQGSSIYFETVNGNSTEFGVFSLDYSTGGVFFSTNNDYVILSSDSLALVSGTGNDLNTDFYTNQNTYKLISYDSKFKFNYDINKSEQEGLELITNTNSTTSNSFSYLNIFGGTPLTFNSNSNTQVNFFGGTSVLPLVDQTKYFNYQIIVGGTIQNTYTLLTEDINTINSLPVIKDSLGVSRNVTSLGVSVILDTQFSSTNGFLQTPELEGINLYTFTIDSTSSGTGSTITIKNRKEVYNGTQGGGNIQNNFPLGFYTEKGTSTNVEVDTENIIITYKNSKLVNQTTQMIYSITDTFDTDFDSSNKTKNASRIDYGTSTQYINFEITNTYSTPNPKIYSSGISGGYSTIKNNRYVFNQPFDTDRVQKYIFQDNLDTSQINVITNYKNINDFLDQSGFEPSVDYNRINLMNETSMRKIKYSFGSNNTIKSIDYLGVKGSPNPSNTFYNTSLNCFGYCTPIKLSSFYPTGSTTSTNNYFVTGSPGLYFRNQQDIDTILKYSSSELVIGFFKSVTNNGKTTTVFNCYVALTNIISYDVDKNLTETLFLDTNVIINPGLEISGSTPYLFPNNIVPVYLSGNSILQDGSLVVTSTISSINDSTNNNGDPYFNDLTGYSKVIQTHYGQDQAQTIQGIYNIKAYPSSTAPPSSRLPTVTICYFVSDVNRNIINKTSKFPGNNLLGNNFNNNTGDLNIQTFLINNLFISSLSLEQSYIMFGITRKVNNRILWSKTFKDKGNQTLSVNTIPFYNGISGSQGSLDLTFKTPFFWSYWINDLNKIPTEINKIIFNFSPGNIENDMFYYVFAKVDNIPRLLFLSTNYTITNIAESEPVPLLLPSGKLQESFYDNFFMTPYNKRLNFLSYSCN